MPEQTETAVPSPWTRPSFVAAAALVGAVAIAGAVIALSAPGRTPDAVAPAAPTVGTAPEPAPSVLPTAIPTRPPTDVTWALVGQQAVPTSPTAGPHTVQNGVAAGYAHTPDGALLAAAQLTVRSGHSAGRASWEPTITRQFTPGPDRDRLLAALRAAPPATPEPGELSPLAGYLYQAYTPDTAVIGLVYRAVATGTATYQVVATTLVWHDGDWAMVPPPGGSWLSVNRQTPDLTGVTGWGAN